MLKQHKKAAYYFLRQHHILHVFDWPHHLSQNRICFGFAGILIEFELILKRWKKKLIERLDKVIHVNIYDHDLHVWMTHFNCCVQDLNSR